jgi:predicted enzyme related to lactoylglutathione lyase
MAIARWKDLCIDASDGRRIGEFWGELLGLSVEVDEEGDACLRGERPDQTIWVNVVPEPRTVKQRVHLDIEAASVDHVLARGATMVLPATESGFAWSIVTDPEGGELCVFERDPFPADPPARLHEIVVDTATEATAEAQARWWADVLGGTVGAPPDGRYSWVEDMPGLGFDGFAFVPVPEPKTVKNRIHWDVTTDDLNGLLARGATILATPTESTGWHVVADPEGNEFCAFPPA